MTTTAANPDERWRLPTVQQHVPMSKAWIYAAMRRGEFPQPRKMGARGVAWVADEVRAWIASRPVAAGGEG